MIPFDDPTILFINAGMNQFKDIFTGKRKVDFNRATSSQKCIRAGGKHNDLDNVGFTARHHTFFEMLGNFSFGDYFKEEAIYYAWEFYTKVLGLPKDKLYATVYETDDDAYELWGKIAPELKKGRIMRFGKKDNYWTMGNVGPCGPCSEIHYDRGEKYGTGPNDVVNGETDRFIEIWNLVFMQYEQLPNGDVVDLPNPSVDTGAGLERNAAILQHAESNYGIDIFRTLIEGIGEITKSKYSGERVPSFHVIADHIRALTFAIADGAGISNEGQGYVLRRILRRAVRHGRLLGSDEPFLFKLIPTLVNEMGEAYPEIKEKEAHIKNVVKLEEESFDRTLDKGLQLFESITKNLKNKIIPGEEVFKLYDTYGFPYDLTEIMATEKGLTLDQYGFEQAMEKQKQLSRAAGKFDALGEYDIKPYIEDFELTGFGKIAETEFVRDALKVEANLLLSSFNPFPNGALVLDRTPFYAESGGQISDTGTIYNEKFKFKVEGMTVHQGYYLHFGEVIEGSAADVNPSAVTAEVDAERRWDIMRNHTVTHLTHAALRKVLGPHIKQSGSYVGPDRMRFDFSHHQPMTDEEIAEVEKIVNNEILKNHPVTTNEMDIESAKKTGAMALFGEKYDNTVRVVSMDDFSKELCGGTHVENSAQIGPFFITLETGIASGVRRIEAITGHGAIDYMMKNKAFKLEVAKIVNRPEKEALDGVVQLKETASSLQKEIKKVKAEMFSGSAESIGAEEQLGDIILSSHDFGETDRDIMSGWMDAQKERTQPVVAVALGMVNGKVTFMASATSSALKAGGDVGKLSKEILPRFGGRGGGKPNFAQGSVAEGTSIEQLTGKFKEILAK